LSNLGKSPSWQAGAVNGRTEYNLHLNVRDVKEGARWRWTVILTEHGIDGKFLIRKHGPCPVCGGKDRFRFDDKNGDGTFFCNHCGAGDGIKLLMLWRRCSFLEAANNIADWLNIGRRSPNYDDTGKPQKPQRETDDHQSLEKQRQAINKIWNESQPICPGDPVYRYLSNRGIWLQTFPDTIRYHPALSYWINRSEKLADFPAMVARYDSPAGEMIALHQTYLNPDGTKATVEHVRKFRTAVVPGGSIGGAIRLFQPSRILAVAEGVETALAVHFIKGWSVWATRTANNMVSVVVPECVKEVIICGDADRSGTGQQAAAKLADRLHKEGKKVQIAIPRDPIEGKSIDWANFLGV
jgi:putative DNA primase/helicase